MTETKDSPSISPDPAQRIKSLDALRGFDMLWILGGDALAQATHRLSDNWLVMQFAKQLDHVAWEGFHFYDLICPLFVFIIGVSITFSLGKLAAREGRCIATRKILFRAAFLYALGIIYYGGFSTSIEQIRLVGVLQRLAACYLCAALIFVFVRPRGIAGICIALLIGYWAMLAFIPVPGFGAGNYAEGKNLTNYLDKQHLPLRKWDGDHDPEGLLSTLPAIASCLLGVLAGVFLQSRNTEARKKARYLAISGFIALLLGIAWGTQFPIIKKIWTSSYVLVAGGYSALLFAFFYWLVDIRQQQKWVEPFLWVGANPITLYLFDNVAGFDKIASRLAGGPVKEFLNATLIPGLGDLVQAGIGIGLCLLLARALYRRGIFIRI